MWEELAHNNKGYLYPTAYYWLAAQYAAKEVGVTDNIIGCWYKNGEFGYLSKDKGLAKSGKKIFDRIIKNADLVNRIVTANQTEIDPMLKAAKRLSGKELNKLSGKELNQRWQDWLYKFIAMMTWSIMGTVMEMEEPYLSNFLENLLAKKLGKDNPEIGEYFQILTTATERTISGQEEIDLLKMKLIEKVSNDMIDEHLNKYSWIGFGYDGPGWNRQDIKNRLEELTDNKDEIQRLIRQREDIENNVLNQQEKIKNKLELSDEENFYFSILRKLGFWKFERKFLNQKAHELMEDFIKVLSKRNNLTIPQAKMIAPNEMEEVLVEGKVDVALLNERLKESIIIFKGTDYKVLAGEQGQRELKSLYESFLVDKSIKEITGNIAFPGKAIGNVKIVDKKEQMDKVNEGDILVSASTSPDILPVMRKAAAIITNSGGITCHAAIVSRELNKPCIIGTKIATKVFKDGDLVEVDATKGVVKKLN